MKNLVKPSIYLLGMLVAVFLVTSCDMDNVEMDDMLTGDEALIQAIQGAGQKSEVNLSELPTVSQDVLEEDYSDSYSEKAMMAADLGYEVSLRKGWGSEAGAENKAYFDISGRELLTGEGREKKRRKHGEGEGDKDKAFELVLPVTFTMPDGSTVTVEDEEGWKAIKEWYKANPDVKERATLQFPVDVTFEDGSVKTINNEEEMKALRKEFAEGRSHKGRHHRAFHFVLPVSFDMPDGSVITIETKEDWAQLRTWRDENPDAEGKPALQFPVTVIIKKDGSERTINNEEEMKALRQEFDKHRKKKPFRFVLPVSFTMPDNSVITIEDEEGWSQIREWHKANPDAEGKAELQYPVTVVITKDGTQKTVNNEEEMKALREEYGKEKKDKPFEFVLPVSFTMPDNSVITINDEDGWSQLRDWHKANPEVKEKGALQFPVTVKLKDGSEKTINNEEEMKALREEYRPKKGKKGKKKR
ncbi:hypothetical protein FUAX_47960 (plasmid) [Fulvitalea axinellae]|uniref:Lipoprotein n=1 Tax=Fulvitalea axinellae TaxID=1182444 RepID=A0AAU9DD20_9BACT|nr:hypothetical protein FUAX_47960 [Fulvitalea axinellae]